jgi:hypothetical protein
MLMENLLAYLKVLKVLSFSKTRVVETLNLRAGSQLNLNYSSNDVKWGNNGKHKKKLLRPVIYT